jgi:predicted transcriptional regulator
MSNTLSVRLPKGLLDRLRQMSRCTGLPSSRIVRHSLERMLSKEVDAEPPWMKYAGSLNGPRNLSSRKGYSRG